MIYNYNGILYGYESNVYVEFLLIEKDVYDILLG